MAINAYTGLMGSGKTYEVILSVILPAIKAGRDVVTNIHGLNEALIHDYLVMPDKGCTFGKIKIVSNDDVSGENFFPEFDGHDFVFHEKTVVRGGNVVAIDEAWRPWGTDSKAVKFQMSFYREHRHCVDQRGISADLVLITQDLTDIHKLLKNVVELSFKFTKLKTLGFSSRYRIEVYEGHKLFKTSRTSWSTKTYNKKIFPLYKSFASEGGGGVEKSIDKRQNMLKSGAFIFPILLSFLMIGFAWWQLTKFFHPDSIKPKAEVANKSNPASISAPATPSTSRPGSPPLAGNESSSQATISGSIVIGKDTWLVLNTSDGMRIASPSIAYSHGVSAITTDGRKAVPAYLSK